VAEGLIGTLNNAPAVMSLAGRGEIANMKQQEEVGEKKVGLG
jgi:hypothetical protein